MTSRRTFVSCASHIALVAAVAPRAAQAAWARRVHGPLVAVEPFGRLEKVAEGVWALISTPLTDPTTVSNGGIIAGRNGVLAIEGFNTPKGAQWIAEQALALTGKRPSHVIVTHYHADHANGVAGYATDGAHPMVHATTRTRDDVVSRNKPVDDARSSTLSEATVINAQGEQSLDLGGRKVRIIPREGHTASDVSLELDDPSIVFSGDLVWNAMFPNYVDATPSKLAAAVKALRRTRDTTYIPGHGSIARDADVVRYQGMLDEVERGARAAHEKGMTAADGAAAFSLPASLGEWMLFNKVFYERAFSAWYRELSS